MVSEVGHIFRHLRDSAVEVFFDKFSHINQSIIQKLRTSVVRKVYQADSTRFGRRRVNEGSTLSRLKMSCIRCVVTPLTALPLAMNPNIDHAAIAIRILSADMSLQTL